MADSGYQESIDKKDIDALNRLDKKSEKRENSMKGAYRLFEEVNNGIRYFGKIKTVNKKETAEFICHCGEAFRSTLPPILSGRRKSCGCKKVYNKK